ncbi:MAG: hypothetical protein M3042_11475 [Actinomycetota bacterium]|nr:hypothetical protein [Actinomycetota bacterium]
MTLVSGKTFRRTAFVLVGALTALTGLLLLSPAAGDAAASYTIAFGSLGADAPRNLVVRPGDTVVFANALPLAPVTGLVVPVKVVMGADTFDVAGTPVSRSISAPTTYTGTYSVLGLIPLTSNSGSINTAAAPPPPPPGGGSAPPPPPPAGGGTAPPAGGGTTPPAGGGTTTPPAHTTPGSSGTTATASRVTGHPVVRPGDPGYVPGSVGSVDSPLLSLSKSAGGPASAGSNPAVPAPDVAGPQVIRNAAAPQPGSDSLQSRLLAADPGASTTFGLAALAGVVLLLGVGTALVRTLISARLAPPARIA